MILVLMISMPSVFAGSPEGHFLGYELDPKYLRVDALFTGEGKSINLQYSIVCGATRKRFEAKFKIKLLSSEANAYTISSPLHTYGDLISFYNKECGRTPAVNPDFSIFYYDELVDRVSVKFQGPGGTKKTLNLEFDPPFGPVSLGGKIWPLTEESLP